jgi:hypothetical protein
MSNSLNIINAIKKIYPLCRGYAYFETKNDGTAWENPIDGLVWENTQFLKPTWQQIETKLNDIKLDEVREIKKAEINAQRNRNMSASVLHTKNGVDHYLQSNVLSRISWLENGNKDIETEWVTDENEIITITKSDFKSISKRLGVRDTQEAVLGRKRKDAVEKLITVEAIEAYDITTTNFE